MTLLCPFWVPIHNIYICMSRHTCFHCHSHHPNHPVTTNSGSRGASTGSVSQRECNLVSEAAGNVTARNLVDLGKESLVKGQEASDETLTLLDRLPDLSLSNQPPYFVYCVHDLGN